ncbi:hypothetical protein PCANC_19858 [Puccinia coronata f. sp. avenae]|uniref:Uncharacterized protein n=1 Tax=Puccinia coronata f. sp. avenae TaxID=200324 RepID=A0A2N5UEV8_9BASI|nr:hypothetical protein PCANC_19858 [Puccinia coronata f. sp. avenae]
MMTSAILSLVILFSSLTNALPSDYPSGNYVSRSYQSTYPSYNYGQQLPAYGYGPDMGPAYYGPGPGPFVGQKLGYPGRPIAHDPLRNAYTGPVWDSFGGPEPVPSPFVRTAVVADSLRGPPDGQRGASDGQRGPPDGQRGPPDGLRGPPDGQRGAQDGQRGAPDGQRGVPDGQQGGGARENLRIVSQCGQTDGGGESCENTRSRGDVQLLGHAIFNGNGNGQVDSQAAQLSLTRQVNQGANTVNGTLSQTTAADQANTSTDLSDLDDAQSEPASTNQTATDNTDATS